MLSLPVHAADPCDGYTWNVTCERAVFATQPVMVTGATTAGPSPALEVDKLYEILLTPQNKVSFVLAPDKKSPADGAFAGLVTLNIPTAGKYRGSISDAFWIDVIADHRFVATDDFTGVHECHAPRKIVPYALPGGNDLMLQFAMPRVPACESQSRPTFLHDGRAGLVEEAVLWHDGEAAVMRERFAHLSRQKREQLLMFVGAL